MVYARFGSTAVFDVNRRDVRFLGRSGRRLVETDNRPLRSAFGGRADLNFGSRDFRI